MFRALEQEQRAAQATASRRRFIAGIGAGIGGAAAALALRPWVASAAIEAGTPLREVREGGTPPGSALAAHVPGALPSNHLAWVWQFNHDGEPERIRDVLAAHGMGITLKTHAGVQWMSKYDPTRNAVSGPQRIAALAAFFEAGGVPFHAWCVVHGTDPVAESAMAAEVLAAGARSLSIDLESYAGFWRGTTQSARLYTALLRYAQPDATVMISMDARPWEIDRIPLVEFAAVANGFAPQVYWSDFGTAANITKYRQAGVDPGTAGVTPVFALDAAVRKLASFGLPIHPIGPGLIADAFQWGQFISGAYARDAETVSVWRLGTTSPRILEYLRTIPPRPRIYVVQPGDSLSRLAAVWNTPVEEIVRTNNLANPNLLVIGQTLTIPRGVTGSVPASARVPIAAAPGGRTHTVQAGDSIDALAVRWNTTAQRIVDANGLANANQIRAGQQLRIP